MATHDAVVAGEGDVMIRKMVRLSVWGTEAFRSDVLGELQRLGVLHVEIGHEGLALGDALRRLKMLCATLQGLLEALRWDEWELLSDELLERTAQGLDPDQESTLKGLEQSVEVFRHRLAGLVAERESYEETFRSLKRMQKELAPFANFFHEALEKKRTVLLFWVPQPAAGHLGTLIKNVWIQRGWWSDREPLLFHRHLQPGTERDELFAVSLSTDAEHRVLEEVIHQEGGARWRPTPAFERVDLPEVLRAIEDGFQWVPRRLSQIQQEMDLVRKEWGVRLGALFTLLSEKSEVKTIENALSIQGPLFHLEGWLPEDRREETLVVLQRRFPEKLFLFWRQAMEDEWHQVPTALRNSSLFAPFEIFVNFFSSPRYMGVDPTVLVGIFFPLFAGCIVGDAGYALLLAMVGVFLRRRPEEDGVWRSAGAVALHVAGWSFAWGVAFGEYFGDVGWRLLGLHPLWVDRAHAVMPLLAFSVVLGGVHVLVGLGIGCFDALRHHHRHLWMERLGTMLVLVGLGLVVIIFTDVLPETYFPASLVLLGGGLVLILVGGGMGGMVEGVEAVGNVLSYVRIAAIGVSSAILASVASTFVDLLGVSFLGLFMALSIHALNIVLAVFESGLHAARLHYVEFFSKFFTGGGKEYAPFRKRRETLWKKHS